VYLACLHGVVGGLTDCLPDWAGWTFRSVANSHERLALPFMYSTYLFCGADATKFSLAPMASDITLTLRLRLPRTRAMRFLYLRAAVACACLSWLGLAGLRTVLFLARFDFRRGFVCVAHCGTVLGGPSPALRNGRRQLACSPRLIPPRQYRLCLAKQRSLFRSSIFQRTLNTPYWRAAALLGRAWRGCCLAATAGDAGERAAACYRTACAHFHYLAEPNMAAPFLPWPFRSAAGRRAPRLPLFLLPTALVSAPLPLLFIRIALATGVHAGLGAVLAGAVLFILLSPSATGLMPPRHGGVNLARHIRLRGLAAAAPCDKSACFSVPHLWLYKRAAIAQILLLTPGRLLFCAGQDGGGAWGGAGASSPTFISVPRCWVVNLSTVCVNYLPGAPASPPGHLRAPPAASPSLRKRRTHWRAVRLCAHPVLSALR